MRKPGRTSLKPLWMQPRVQRRLIQWRNSGLEQRYNALMAIGQEMIARSAELGELLSREEGKPRPEGVGRGLSCRPVLHLLRCGNTAPDRRYRRFRARQHRDRHTTRTGWRCRNHLAVEFPDRNRQLENRSALAFGNAVIWKPANLTPASAVAFAEIVERQDLPRGLFNLVMGSGSAVGQHLVESSKVDAISFTGSVPVGRSIASAARNFTKIQLEMGSKNALAVMDDCDLDLAVSCALNGAFGGTGQKCTASSRLIVHEAVHDEFVDRLVAGAQAFKVGHALEEGTQIGPVVSAGQLQGNLDYIELGKSEGADLLCGGGRLELPTEGYYMQPAVFANTNNAMRINSEEMFAPIACVIKVGSYEEALQLRQ